MNNYITSINKSTLDKLIDEVLNKKQSDIKIQYNIDKENIILYGAGNLGIMAVELLNRANIKPKYIVDKSELKIGTNINKIKILSPNDIPKDDIENATFAVCIVNFPFEEVREYLSSIGCKNIVPFWDVAEFFKEEIKVTNGWYCNSLSEIDKSNLYMVYNNFNDDISRALFIQVLFWRIRRQEIIFKDAQVRIEDKFFPIGIMPRLTENEFLIDCGAYNGNTIKSFMNYTNNKFKKVIAFEPDINNYKELLSFISTVEEGIGCKIITYPFGVGDIEEEKAFISGLGMAGRFGEDTEGNYIKRVSLNNFLKNDSITFLKIHVEGEEYKVLQGALNIIKKDRPIIIITIYHSIEGLWKISKLLMEELQNYCYYHRLHGYCGNESVLYVFPKERI